MKNRTGEIFFIIFALLTFVIANGCKSNSNYGTNPPAPNPGGNTGANQVVMQNTSFSPSSITVAAGSTITWTNKDSFAHTVTSGTPGAPDNLFDSGNIAAGGIFSHTFSTAGTFKYYCKIHGAMMTGTVTVTSAPGGTGGNGGGGGNGYGGG